MLEASGTDPGNWAIAESPQVHANVSATAWRVLVRNRQLSRNRDERYQRTDGAHIAGSVKVHCITLRR